MKKRLSLVLCLCVFMAAVAGCSDKKDDSKTETIAAEDNVENLHKALMENVGDYALKYATISDYKNMQIEIEPLQEFTDSEQDLATIMREKEIEYAIRDKLVETIEVKDVPKEQMSYYQNRIVSDIESVASGQNMTVEEYMEKWGMANGYDEWIENTADEWLKYEYAVICIGEAENWLPTEEEYTTCLQEEADRKDITLEEYRKQYESQYDWNIYFEAYENNVLEKLKESAVIKEK